MMTSRDRSKPATRRVARSLSIALALAVATGAEGAIATGPAEAGDATVVANRVIRFAKVRCAKVVSAVRLSRGAIVARCSDGERYRIYTVGAGRPVAVRCDDGFQTGFELGCRPSSRR